jgi:23S rRNA pseudouridine2605 synthase
MTRPGSRGQGRSQGGGQGRSQGGGQGRAQGRPGARGGRGSSGAATGAASGAAPGGTRGDPGSTGLSAADLARARAAAASLGDDFDRDDGWGQGDEYAERDSLTDVPGGVRLQKVLAAAGVGSRRYCEELIGAGRVEVDGEIVRRFGARVDPQHQIIRVDGRRIPASEDLVYVALNKPSGVLTSMSDSRGRKTMADLLGDIGERLFHVGRLDYDTEGLMLLTNDGELAHRLAHPRFGVPKTYLAEVPGPVPKDLGRQLITGIELEDGVASADKFRVVEQVGDRALVEITLHEGRKHIVKRMLAAAGHPVSRLVRTQVGPVSLGSLRPGTTRRLSTKEIGDLYSAVGL